MSNPVCNCCNVAKEEKEGERFIEIFICNQCTKEQFKPNTMNDKQLISFGNYLLSSKRTVSELLKGEVTHADLENWKGMQKRNWLMRVFK